VQRFTAKISLTGTLLLMAACGGPKTVSRDGYRALLVFGTGEKYTIAVRGEKRRAEGVVDGSTIVKIVRPDLAKVWQYRPSTKKILEEKWEATDEIVPGYPLEPRFDPEAYGHRFGAAVKQIGDGVHGIHPCDRYQLALPSGDRVTVWAARDLERIPVRVEHEKKNAEGSWSLTGEIQLLDVRTGADESLFDPPKGYAPAKSRDLKS
jgi:hypothetical protein